MNPTISVIDKCCRSVPGVACIYCMSVYRRNLYRHTVQFLIIGFKFKKFKMGKS